MFLRLCQNYYRKKKCLINGIRNKKIFNILRGLDLGGIKILNVDDIYVPLLKKANVTLDLKNATPEERSKQAIANGCC